MTDAPPVLLNEKEASKIVGLEVSTLRKRRCEGRSPIFLKMGGRICYTMKDLVDFMNASKVYPLVPSTDLERVFCLINEVKDYYHMLNSNESECEHFNKLEYEYFNELINKLEEAIRSCFKG